MNMKKGFLAALFTLGIATWASAQAPTAVSAAFQHAKPGVTAEYVQEGPVWKARFTENGKQTFLGYGASGDYLFKEITLEKRDVPAAILTDMEQRFSSPEPDVNIFEGVAKRILPDGTVHYEYQFRNGNRHVEVFYGESGQIVKRNIFE